MALGRTMNLRHLAQRQVVAPQRTSHADPGPARDASLLHCTRARTRLQHRSTHLQASLDVSPSTATSTAQTRNPDFSDLQCKGSEMCLTEEQGAVLIRDDLDALIRALPDDIREPLIHHPCRKDLLEVILDLGRQPEARFLNQTGGEFLREAPVTAEDLQQAEASVGAFGRDNRAGITGTLHRISAIRNRRGHVIGLTCRIGRAVSGHADMLRDLVESHSSVLLLGRPGVGKTTIIRELARCLADELHKRVVIVDTSNEIGGDGDVPHPAIGGARRMQVPDPARQHHVMIEAVENHTPEVIIVDEIGSEAEALACRTIAERGITLVGTAHGRTLDNLIQNPSLNDLVGGIHAVTLGDDVAKSRGTKKTVLERKAPPTFPIIVEIRDRSFYVAHWAQESVDCLLHGKVPVVQVRERNHLSHEVSVSSVKYDEVAEPAQPPPGHSAYEADYEEALQAQKRAKEAAARVAAAEGGVLSNAVPWRAREEAGGEAGKGRSGGEGEAWRGAGGREGAAVTPAGGPRGFGGPATPGSVFLKPHVSVMPGGVGGGSKRSKSRAAAKKLR